MLIDKINALSEICPSLTATSRARARERVVFVPALAAFFAAAQARIFVALPSRSSVPRRPSSRSELVGISEEESVGSLERASFDFELCKNLIDLLRTSTRSQIYGALCLRARGVD
jgi:hypothetical protein